MNRSLPIRRADSPIRVLGRRRRLVFALATLTAAGAAGAVVLQSPASAVVDGEPTAIAQAPWQVSLQDGSGHFCGGSVIDASTIVTAAHCVEGSTGAGLFVRAGVTDRTDSTGQDRDVARVIVHPGGFDAAADVALLVLARPLSLGASVQTIGLASAADVAGASSAVVSGWGARAEDDADGSTTLLSAEVPILDDATCQAALGGDGGIVAANELCAEGLGAGSCYGDRGGPLTVVGVDGTVKLAGVVSWGIECAVSPGVFAEVPTFAGWIVDGAAAGVGDTPHPDGEMSPDEVATDVGWDDGWDDSSDDSSDDEAGDAWDDQGDLGVGGAAGDGADAGCLDDVGVDGDQGGIPTDADEDGWLDDAAIEDVWDDGTEWETDWDADWDDGSDGDTSGDDDTADDDADWDDTDWDDTDWDDTDWDETGWDDEDGWIG